jgi:hypothetical protein
MISQSVEEASVIGGPLHIELRWGRWASSVVPEIHPTGNPRNRGTSFRWRVMELIRFLWSSIFILMKWTFALYLKAQWRATETA